MKFKTSLTLILVLATVGSMIASSITFHNGNFESAKRKAASENKLVILEFYATWCIPCQWMEETTFADPEVIRQMNENYVPVKINIDDFDGYALKEQYGVKILPTMLIFSADGEIVERIEETLPPSRMQQILHKNKTVKAAIVHEPNRSPESLTKINKKPQKSESGYEYHAKTFKLQLGYFENYENTISFYSDMKKKVNEPMVILHDFQGTSVTYRVLIGNYGSEEEAQVNQKRLKTNYDVDSHLYR